MTKAIALVSGGLDSAVALWWARARFEVTALTFDGRDRPRGEARACEAVVRAAGVPLQRVALPFLAAQASGYVPGRNLVFHAVAASIAESCGAAVIVAGHNLSDARAFADARPAFFRSAQRLLNGVRIALPFARLTDARVIALGRRLGAPVELTWSCYRDGARPCGRCSACRGRRDAFQQSGAAAR